MKHSKFSRRVQFEHDLIYLYGVGINVDTDPHDFDDAMVQRELRDNLEQTRRLSAELYAAFNNLRKH